MEFIWMALIIGAASFGHCLGMCGPFALHLAGHDAARKGLGRQLLWHGGKTVSYIFLGALAGFFGNFVISLGWPWLGRALTWTLGALMILMGLAMLGLLPLRRRSAGVEGGVAGSLLGSLLGPLLGQPSSAGAFALGIASGFLPCGIVWAVLAMSVQSGSVLIGMATMAALGVGTMWALLALGLTGGLMKTSMRRGATVMAGGLLILLGGVTALRGSGVLHWVLPAAVMPASMNSYTPGRGTVPDCCKPSAAQPTSRPDREAGHGSN